MKTGQAEVADNKISVRHTTRPDIKRQFLTFSVENGWDEVKKFVNKVLVFEGRDYVFSAWNSDRNEVYFVRQLTALDPRVTSLDADTICWSSATIKNK